MDRDDPKMTTREFEKITTSPQQLEEQLRQDAARLRRVTATGMLLIFVLTFGTLVYTVRTLNAVQDATSPEARERTAEVVTDLITRVDCANRDNLEEAVNALLDELAEQEGRGSARIRLEPTERCN